MAAIRSIILVILYCLLCVRGEAVNLETQKFGVAVCNDAHIPDNVLDKAQEIAQSIYEKAGLGLVWTRCGGGSEQRGATRIFSIRILSRSLDLRGEVFGVAFLGSDGLGMQADVFYSGIVQLQRNRPVDSAKILGCVIAHELGHLLLGQGSHSGMGIMQAHWESRQLRQISMGLLGFDLRQTELIRARLLGVYARERSELRAATPNFTGVSPPPL
jgi:hypothetical protein